VEPRQSGSETDESGKFRVLVRIPEQATNKESTALGEELSQAVGLFLRLFSGTAQPQEQAG
jgi:hypothetical protein